MPAAPLVQHGGDLLLAERRDQEAHRRLEQAAFACGVDQGC
jgi:hypothetical protein